MLSHSLAQVHVIMFHLYQTAQSSYIYILQHFLPLISLECNSCYNTVIMNLRVTLFLAILVLLLINSQLHVINSPNNTKVSVIPTPRPAINQEKDLATIVSEWSPYVVLVTCWWRDITPSNNIYCQRGSSIIRYNEEVKKIDILTNRHVLSRNFDHPDEC